MMKKNIIVTTNDPVNSTLSLTITGVVEKIVDISPQRIRLIGPEGQLLVTTVNIMPEKKYAFKIVEAKAKSGEHITVSISEEERTEGFGYLLTVKNLKKNKGRYIDTILLKTNSKFRPIIQIQVTGNIT